MAVLGAREILPRTYQHKLGDKPTASRVFVATVDGPSGTSAAIGYIGINHGSSHPEHTFLTCETIEAEETDRHHVTVTYGYVVAESDSDDPNQPPWAQPDQWSFSTSNASVACTYHYPTNFNNDKTRPLTNSAGDKIFGVSRPESELKITLTGARLRIKIRDVQKIVNSVNDQEWFGFPWRTVQCVGFSATPDQLEFEGVITPYWRINVELVYRPSTHDLFLPNVGWNVIEDGKLRRAYVYAKQDGESVQVAAPHPVALDMGGGFLCPPEP